MALNIYTSDRTSERAFPWLWFVRLLQLFVTIIVLGVTASNASDFSSIGCSVPSKLGYNIAAAVLSFIVLLVLIFSTGTKPLFRSVPWFAWGQLGLDAFMFIIWIAAAGVSKYNCDDLCSACSGYEEVWSGGLNCLCDGWLYYNKRDQSPAPKGPFARGLEKRRRRSHGPGASKIDAKIAFDAIMVVLFAFTTAATIYWILKARRSGTAAATTTSQPPAAHGLEPTPVPGTAIPEKTNTATPYTGQVPAPQNAYPSQSYEPQTQPPMQYGDHLSAGPAPQMHQPPIHHENNYPEPISPPSTYPTPAPQGTAGEYYSQGQPQGAGFPADGHAGMQGQQGMQYTKEI
ncbi:MAG: hypothetical protein Q9220_001463 [cf. Caloplaca sp. 1 TL-2023]